MGHTRDKGVLPADKQQRGPNCGTRVSRICAISFARLSEKQFGGPVTVNYHNELIPIGSCPETGLWDVMC